MEDYTHQISENLTFRSAREADIPAIAAILRDAVTRMLAEGKQQWNESYPTADHVRGDMESGRAYVMERDGGVAGYVAVALDGEPAYDSLRGDWLTEGPYVVAHRMALGQSVQGLGLGRAMIAAIEEFARAHGIGSFRVDTNFDNFAMLGLLKRMGFHYCGEVSYASGSRKAFEKILL